MNPESDTAPVEADIGEPQSVPDAREAESVTDEATTDEGSTSLELESEPPPSEPIPDDILKTARAVMSAFAETQPGDYVARLEASPGEWMTVTDDSLSNELERELLTSAAAMCLWQEWMV